MAATIVTISQIGVSGVNIQIKVNDGHPIPIRITTDDIQSFRTWNTQEGHIFIWTDNQNREISMTVPYSSIGWVMSSMYTGIDGDRFRIDDPCEVDISAEVLPA